jgi:Flp pilus assembly CpaF family ATPase
MSQPGGGYASQDTPVPFEAPSREVMPAFGEASQFPSDTPVPAPRVAAVEVRPVTDGYQELLSQVVRAAHQRTGEVAVGDEVARARLRPTVEQVARGVSPLPPGITAEQLTRDALTEIAGFGAFEAALEDPGVTSAVLDPSGHVALGRGGLPVPGNACFSSGDAAAACLRRLLDAHGIALNGALVRASLRDGTRITVVSPPMSRGLSALLERSPAQPTNLLGLAGLGVLSSQVAQHLAQAVAARRNIAVVGACGASRDALLGALVAAVPAGDRLVSVTAAGGLGGARPNAVALCADGRWDEAVSVARAMLSPRNVLGESNVLTARTFLNGLVNGSESWVLGVDAPTAAAGISRLANLVAHDHWLSREEAVQRLHVGRVLVVETARDADGSPRVLSLSDVRADGGLQRLDG